MLRYLYPVLSPIKRRIVNVISNPSIILLYHRVTKLQRDPQLLAVSPENFESQVRILKKHCNLLSPEEYVELLDNYKKMPPRAVLMTFDDGYADNHLEARPILESHKARALFYITTSKLGTSEKLWWDEIEEVMFDGELNGPIELQSHGQVHTFQVRHEKDREEIYKQLHPIVKHQDIQRREDLIKKIRAWGNVKARDTQSHRLLTLEELAEFSKSPACLIGAHTLDHPMLSSLTPDAQLRQIAGSKEFLETKCGYRIDHFSYPFGAKMHDYSKDTREICSQLGFKLVTSNYYGQVHSWTDRLQMPRILVRDWNEEVFTANLKKWFKW